jgi:hypothetical protein
MTPCNYALQNEDGTDAIVKKMTDAKQSKQAQLFFWNTDKLEMRTSSVRFSTFFVIALHTDVCGSIWSFVGALVLSPK